MLRCLAEDAQTHNGARVRHVTGQLAPFVIRRILAVPSTHSHGNKQGATAWMDGSDRWCRLAGHVMLSLTRYQPSKRIGQQKVSNGVSSGGWMDRRPAGRWHDVKFPPAGNRQPGSARGRWEPLVLLNRVRAPTVHGELDLSNNLAGSRRIILVTIFIFFFLFLVRRILVWLLNMLYNTQ